jgi:uncharacterized RDD family membrane protein YckC
MRNFSARETEWLQELDGIELAGFWRRAFAITIDGIFNVIIFSILATLLTGAFLGIQKFRGKSVDQIDQIVQVVKDNASDPGPHTIAEKKLPSGVHYKVDANAKEGLHLINEVVIPVLYFGILLWKGKGRTPGKRIMKIRVVSLVHRHLSFWHCVERALGYGAAGLEGGFGFIQFFIHPYRRCIQDRIAETIVVTESSYQALQHRLAHPLIPDGAINSPDLLPGEEPTAR